MKMYKWIILSSVLNWSMLANGVLVELNQDQGKVEFVAIGSPGFLKIQGSGTAPKGEVVIEGDTIKGLITFELSSLDTGMGLRNTHMKEKYLQIKEHPKATLKLDTKLKSPEWSGETLKLKALQRN